MEMVGANWEATVVEATAAMMVEETAVEKMVAIKEKAVVAMAVVDRGATRVKAVVENAVGSPVEDWEDRMWPDTLCV